MQKPEDIRKLKGKINSMPASAERASKVSNIEKEIDAIQKAIDKKFYEQAHQSIDVVDDKLIRIERMGKEIAQEANHARTHTNEAMKT